MTPQEEAYLQGFVEKCAQYDVNAEALYKYAARGDMLKKFLQSANSEQRLAYQDLLPLLKKVHAKDFAPAAVRGYGDGIYSNRGHKNLLGKLKDMIGVSKRHGGHLGSPAAFEQGKAIKDKLGLM